MNINIWKTFWQYYNIIHGQFQTLIFCTKNLIRLLFYFRRNVLRKYFGFYFFLSQYIYWKIYIKRSRGIGGYKGIE